MYMHITKFTHKVHVYSEPALVMPIRLSLSFDLSIAFFSEVKAIWAKIFLKMIDTTKIKRTKAD